METLFALLIGFALADFAMQSDAMARGKNRHNKPSYIPAGQTPVAVWPYYLSAHALIHAGAVWCVTGDVRLGVAEFVLHWIIDFLKCENITNPHMDQLLHFMCRVIYAVIASV